MEKDRLCQLSYKRLNEDVDAMFDRLYNPGLPIEVGAMAVHHITNEMVADKEKFVESDEYNEVKELLEGDDTVVVAHNAPFDMGMLKKEEIENDKVIDTLKLVRFLDDKMVIQSHGLQYLRYLLKLDEDIDEPIRAHDAKSDVIVLELLFLRLFKKIEEKFSLSPDESILKMMEISSNPVFIPRLRFGKYKGAMLEEVANKDRSYLEWLLSSKLQSPEGEEDWIYSLQKVLEIKEEREIN